jgi:hypothetical protein
MKALESTANVPLMLDFVSRSVIHRLNFPKREAGGTAESDLAKLSERARAGKVKRLATASLGDKSRPRLSPEDCDEVRQACALALVACGSFESATLSGKAWLACFRAARVAIGIDRRWKRTGGDDTVVLGSLIAPLGNPEEDARRRMHLARRARYMRACLFAHFQADKSRKRRSAYRGHVATLRAIMAGTLRHRGMSNAEISATGKRVSRMAEAVASGEALLSAEAEAVAKSRAPRPRYVPISALVPSRAMASRFRPRLADALGFNP